METGLLWAMLPVLLAALWMILRQLWWRNRNKAVTALAQSLGFQYLDKTLPDNFPLEEFPLEKRAPPNHRHFREVWSGKLQGRQLIFFLFNSSWSGRGEILQTVVAVHGGKECFPAAQSIPELKLESADSWTIAYQPRKVLNGTAMQGLLSAVPAKV